jgi:hypothetical protein
MAVSAPVITALAATAAAGASVYQAMQKPSLPDAPKAPEVPKTPAAPDVAAVYDQRRRALASTGRAGTILTSPLGVPGNPSTAPKTLLGG